MNFILEFFFLISGVGAASGLLYEQDRLFVISDDSNYIYQYNISKNQLEKHLLYDDGGDTERVKKSEKLDLEAITKTNDAIYLFPSGSKSNRTKSFKYNQLDSSHAQVDLVEMYSALCQKFGLSGKDFNIEGAFFQGNQLYLFNRGNGPNAINGIYVIDQKNFSNTRFEKIELPKINGVNSGFTDAILLDGKIYFLAAAEGTSSTVNDGEILGSQVGIIDINTLKLEKVETISNKNKFEGITLYERKDDKLIFLLCEDPDNGSNETSIYKLELNRD